MYIVNVCDYLYFLITQQYNQYLYIYKENCPFQHFWVGFFFPKIPFIFNTNNTCNK